MTKKMIEETKKLLGDRVKLNKNGLANLEKTEQVKLYFNIMDSMTFLEAQQAYLEQVVIGEDDTVFSPFDKYTDKVYNPDHQTLLKLLTVAMTTKEVHNIVPTISVDELITYSKAVKKNMTKMCYMEGDAIDCVIEELTIYKNPSNYTFFDFENFKRELTTESFKQSYTASLYFDYDDEQQQFTKKDKERSVFSVFTPKVTYRELNAYFDSEALTALNIYSYQQEITAPLKKVMQRTETND